MIQKEHEESDGREDHDEEDHHHLRRLVALERACEVRDRRIGMVIESQARIENLLKDLLIKSTVNTIAASSSNSSTNRTL